MKKLSAEWTNWSEDLRFTPKSVQKPKNEEELSECVREAAVNKRTVRVVGSCHSSSPIIEALDILVSLDNFQGVESYELDKHTVTIRAGMTLRDTNKKLLKVGLETHNLGDVNTQTVAGAISTGTHGTGKNLQNLATMLIGGRLVTASGDIIELSEQKPEFLLAAQASLGTLGIFTSLKLKLVPAQQLRLKEWCTNIDNCLKQLDHLVEQNHNFDFYWYPRSDHAKLRIMNPPQETLQKSLTRNAS